MKKFSATALAFAFSLIVGAACGGEAEETIDCQFSCQAYADCIDSDYDVAECRRQCDEQDKGEQADDCEKCVRGDKSCVEKTFQCSDECAGIIAGV